MLTQDRIPAPGLLIVIVGVSAGLAYRNAPARNTELDNLTKSGLVPDLIDHQPRQALIVKYGDEVVRQGNELSLDQVKDAPRTYLPRTKRGKLYTIFMLDPDAPSRGFPLLSPLLHYMVANAPRGDNLLGDEIVPYTPPAAPPGTGYHRYVFLVYEQKTRISPSPMLPLLSRYRFTLDNLSERAELIGPVAANFFVSQFTLKK